jgi:hypothetical protein
MSSQLEEMVRQVKAKGNVEEKNVQGLFDIDKVKERYREYLESRPYFPPS